MESDFPSRFLPPPPHCPFCLTHFGTQEMKNGRKMVAPVSQERERESAPFYD